MRRILILAALLASGCSLLTIERLDSKYSGKTEPRCDTGTGPIVIDVVFGLLSAAAVVAEATQSPINTTLLAGNVLETLVDFASAGAGSSWTKECETARARWDRHVLRQEEAYARRREREREEDRRSLEEDTPDDEPIPDAPLRGFFCASSTMTTASTCAREKSDCEKARTIDMGSCALVESAWCNGDRCAVTEAECTSIGGTCVETK